uniref:Uncharacterized protein n=1 Tax=Craspedostauros australis TaxID=1486917 RepID=A0A7R9ZSX1_9STRA|mmetsp:Transcript_929/g.2646  ORF Transcript_929/g.2646 Transcript_929/m.2646 type:complete len:201 (+) Transcript_929:153-755(+)|eukprot:CAMPEP_0198113626 /NCGR_PEP_ID=MMETSP1442-20131203/5254_1 /TAXON_ID= /ORGANISM="Craspedostauros australis, Strain CCMP3328" /LENGTH=200 /DNA_ID=CAMNT_0043770767 /DNA_START=55 /DNA_END=657 /DNA_ORIENTATION=-
MKTTSGLFALSCLAAGSHAFQPTSIHKPETSTVHHMTPEIVEPSYNLALGALGVGVLGGALEDLRNDQGDKLPTAKLFGGAALLFATFALFLAFQTTTLRFAFDDDAFALVKTETQESFENVVVGGTNSWKYESFVNWSFLPSKQFPILVYFRETQTPVDMREDAPIVVDDLDGQVHFFPSISNAQQLEDGFLRYNCKKL